MRGCSGHPTISQMPYVCTDFSTEENWSFGEHRFPFNFTALTIDTDDNITIGFASCCWIQPFSGGSWSLATTLSLVKRNDTGKINSSPRAITAPVIRLQEGCNHTIPLAVSDPDGDTVRCRWANSSLECESICNEFPGASLDPVSCTITYSANNGIGFKAAAIMLEDFSAGSSQPLSSVGLQFLVLVVSSTEQCSKSPTFIHPTLPQGSCVSVPPMASFTTQLRANGSGSNISEIETISPLGTSKGVLQHIVGTTVYYVNITWTPKPSQYNQNYPFCYTALNSAGLASEQTCIQILTAHLPPTLVNGTNIPNNQSVLTFNTTWRARFDRSIRRPSTAAFITFHEYTTGEEVYRINTSSSPEISFSQSNEISIRPNYVFPEGKKIYIQFSKGVVKEESGCGLVNELIGGKDFWLFETKMSTESAAITIVMRTQPTPSSSKYEPQTTTSPSKSPRSAPDTTTASPSNSPRSAPDTTTASPSKSPRSAPDTTTASPSNSPRFTLDNTTGDAAMIAGLTSIALLLALTVLIIIAGIVYHKKKQQE